MISGPCTGQWGLVTGKHGGINHVMVDFPTPMLRQLQDRRSDPGLWVVYVATAQVAMSEADPEMAARIARHRARRPHDWVLIEKPLRLAERRSPGRPRARGS